MRLLILFLISAAALSALYGFTRPLPAQVVLTNISTTTTAATATQSQASSTGAKPAALVTKVVTPKKKVVTRPTVVATSTTPKPTFATTTPTVSATSTTATQRIEALIHQYINVERVTHGLAELGLNQTLSALARAHSVDMQAHDYFEHDDLQGCSVSCRVDAVRYHWRSVGENIYMMSGYTLSEKETAQKIVDGWMNSPGHRANILNGSFTEEGIGIAMVGESVYATEDFAKPR